MAHQLRVEGDKVIEADEQGHVLAKKDYSHVHAGYVATLHSPRVSQEAKENAEKLLHDLEVAHGDTPSKISYEKGHGPGEHVETHQEEVHRHRQIGTYKGILHKQGVSEEAKEHARQMLKEFGVDPAEFETGAKHEEGEKKH
ncbi:hypothetical protein JCM5350_000847 [Sporobolomyces pararoseus]